jgi:hypothetical protein
MQTDDISKCAHENCSCPAAPGSKYCSPSCESAKDTAEITCTCEHPECAGRVS